ncbi:MAG: hypothetical protein Q8K58_00780 [Acidimicrobiales bacterium]|nr:hypothetical protein [Acidimicrobiales bacterium]
MPTLQLDRPMDVRRTPRRPPSRPIVLPPQGRRFGRGNPAESRRAVRAIVLGAVVAAALALAATLALSGDSVLARAAQFAAMLAGASSGAALSAGAWYRGVSSRDR